MVGINAVGLLRDAQHRIIFHLARARGASGKIIERRVLQAGERNGTDITDVESEQMKAAGITLDVTVMTGSACLQTFSSKKIFPAWQGSFSGRPDPFLTYQQNFGSSGQYNLAKLAHPGVDALLDKILATDDPKVQQGLYREINRLWIDNAPFILLFYRPNFAAYNKAVSGEVPNLQGKSNLVTMFYK